VLNIFKIFLFLYIHIYYVYALVTRGSMPEHAYSLDTPLLLLVAMTFGVISLAIR
jgi:hypothetical protein